jgi:hypothetical protein
MLYLHCGWPRTATTTLQTALLRNRERLAEVGIVYPEKWRSHTGNPTHHGIIEMLRPAPDGSPKATDELKQFLIAHRDEQVLLSAEGLTTSLVVKRRENGLPRLIEVAGEMTTVRCVWSMRRVDDSSISTYLLRLRRHSDFPSVEAFLAKRPAPDRLFAGMRAVEETLAGNAVYVKYERGGAHMAALLNAFDVPEPVRGEILTQLEGERLNGSLTYKQATAIVHRDVLSTRAGVELDFPSLRRAFREFRFERDWRFEPVGSDVRQRLHEQALTSARRQDFVPYIELFGEVEIPPSSPTPTNPDAIDVDDLARLVEHVRSSRSDAVPA